MKIAMQRTLRSRRGQSMAEYAMLLAFVLAFIMMIAGFFKNHMAGTVTAGVNNYTSTVSTALGGAAVAPYAPTATSTSGSSDSANYQGTGQVTTGSNSNSNSSSTSTF